MNEPHLLSILHISDFHYAKRKHKEQAIIVDALVADLKTLCIGHRKPDLIVFTGDLVQAAGVDSHDDAYDVLIDRVSKATGCSDERIFIVPGNHDLSWTGLDAHAEEHRSWRDVLGTAQEMSQLNQWFEEGAFNTPANSKFSNFYELERFLGGDQGKGTRRHRSAFATVDHIEALNVDLVVFNTAVLSAGGREGFAKDERNLAVPEYAVIEAIKALTPGSFRIFATHHPFGMLSEQSARYLEGEITRHASVHLFGHMHDPQPRSVVGLTGSVLSDQAGALFTARKEYYNGYSLLTIDRSVENFSETLIRSYFKERNAFDDGVDIAPGGRWYPSPAASQHFRKIAAPVNEMLFRKHLQGPALSRLKQEESVAGGEANIHERFVSPPLRRTFIQEVTREEAKTEEESPVAFCDVIVGDANLILYAKAEYGRTTLLRELRYQLLASADSVRFPRLPIMLDFEDISNNADNMLRLVRGRAEVAPDGHDVESLLKLGHACVLIDDVQFADRSRMSVLRQFVSRFPKARYIFSSPHNSASQYGAHVDPETPLRFEFVEVQELRRNDMRQLLTKYERCTDIEVWLDRLQQEFREINLPFTAANGSILIEILSEKYNFTPINRSVLMEQFVDSTLRKTAIEQSRREVFDYTNKTDLLAHVAAWMARSDNYIPAKESLRTEMKAYVDARGLVASLDDLLHEFLTARIFVSRSDDRISFRYRGVLEYFIALRMISDSAFKEWIMEEERYLRYLNEILYYAGKHRGDTALVQIVHERHQAIIAEALSDIDEFDLDQLAEIQLPDEDGEGFGSIIDEFASPPLSQQEKDAELEAGHPVDAEERQEVYRPRAEEISDRVLLSLILLSGLVKNMEHISDADKRRHLAEVWRGWSLLLVASLRVAPKLARERRIRVNGAMYEVLAPHGMTDTALLRQMMLRLPHVHVRALAMTLGTEKLERQLTEPTLETGKDPVIYDFLRTGLIADLRLGSTPGAIQALALQLKDNPYLLWSLIVHLSELRRLDGIKEEHFRVIEGTLAKSIANLKGGSHKEKQDEQRRQLTRLSKDRLLLTLKRDKE